MSGIHLGLENMRILMSYLPPVEVPYIHIAGTNGKGSVSAMLDSCLRQAGLRTGRYNSPHLITIRDSILLDGREVEREAYKDGKSRVLEAVEEHKLTASEFEITTATAFLIFATRSPPLDILIIECGMGGLRDATNVLPKESQLCSVLTMVDLDHQGFLGNTVEEIAADKCGIMALDGTMVVGRQDHSMVYGVVERRAVEVGTDFVYAGWDGPKAATTSKFPTVHSGNPDLTPTTMYSAPPLFEIPEINLRGPLTGSLRIREPMPVPLPGDHQRDNTALAVAVLITLTASTRAIALLPGSLRLDPTVIREGLNRTEWKGRCSWVLLGKGSGVRPTRVLVDGAHNTAASTQLRSYIESCSPSRSKPVTYILGLSHSPPKTPLQVLRPLLKAGDRVAITSFTTPIEGMPWIKPVPRGEVLEAVMECGVELQDVASDEIQGLEQALAWAVEDGNKSDDGLIVITGSLYLVADVYRLNELSHPT